MWGGPQRAWGSGPGQGAYFRASHVSVVIAFWAMSGLSSRMRQEDGQMWAVWEIGLGRRDESLEGVGRRVVQGLGRGGDFILEAICEQGRGTQNTVCRAATARW